MKKLKALLSATMIMCSVAMATGICAGAENTVGDVNSDGKFTIADVTLFQRWIVGKDVSLDNWQSADFTGDDVLDVFDLCMMKNKLLTHNNSGDYPIKNPVIIDEFTPCTVTIDDDFDDWNVMITIKHQYSVSDRVWTKDDFKDIENIRSLSQIEAKSPYRQIVSIGLQEYSKENVLKMIHEIEALNMPEIKEVWTVKHGRGLNPQEYPVADPVVIDEFTPYTYDIRNCFNGMLYVDIKHQYSIPERVWTADDFEGVENIKSVSQKDNIDTDNPYRQTVVIELENKSSEDTLKAVHDIEGLGMPEIKQVRVSQFGTGALPMTPEEWDAYVDSIRQENSGN